MSGISKRIKGFTLGVLNAITVKSKNSRVGIFAQSNEGLAIVTSSDSIGFGVNASVAGSVGTAGLVIDSTGISATTVTTDTIYEDTTNAGVSADGVLFHDGTVTDFKKVVTVTSDANYSILTSQSGTLFVLDKATGTAFTLPAAVSMFGAYYEFFVHTTAAGGNYTILCAGGDNFEGVVLNVDKDQVYTSTEALQRLCAANGTPTTITLNGGTTGGMIGSRIRVTSINDDRWLVEGVVLGDSNVTTIFS